MTGAGTGSVTNASGIGWASSSAELHVRCSPRRRPISATLIYRSFQSPYVSHGVHFHDRNPRRYSAAGGLKAQRSSTPVDVAPPTLHHSGGIPYLTDDIIRRVLLRPVSGAFGGPTAQAGQPSPSNHFIGSSRRKCRTRIRRAGHGLKSACAAEVGDDVYSSWFARMDLEAIEEGAVRLSVPTRFLKSWIQSHYAERVLACWQAQEGKVTRVELIVRSAVLKSAMLPKAKPDIRRPKMAAATRMATAMAGRCPSAIRACTRRSAARRSIRA